MHLCYTLHHVPEPRQCLDVLVAPLQGNQYHLGTFYIDRISYYNCILNEETPGNQPYILNPMNLFPNNRYPDNFDQLIYSVNPDSVISFCIICKHAETSEILSWLYLVMTFWDLTFQWAIVSEQAEQWLPTEQAKAVWEQPAMSATVSEHTAITASFVAASSYCDDCQGASSIICYCVVTGSNVFDCIRASSHVQDRGRASSNCAKCVVPANSGVSYVGSSSNAAECVGASCNVSDSAPAISNARSCIRAE